MRFYRACFARPRITSTAPTSNCTRRAADVDNVLSVPRVGASVSLVFVLTGDVFRMQDLQSMGFALVSYTVNQVEDTQG